MKRIITLISILFIIVGCSPQEVKEVSISLKEKDPVDAQQITILVDNPSSETIYFSDEIKFFTMINGVETEILPLVEPDNNDVKSLNNGVLTITKNLISEYGELEAKEYFIILPYSKDSSGKPLQEARVDFELAEPKTSSLIGEVLYDNTKITFIYASNSAGLFTMPSQGLTTHGDRFEVEYDVASTEYPAQINPISIKKLEPNPTKMVLAIQLITQLLIESSNPFTEIKEIPIELEGFNGQEKQAIQTVLQYIYKLEMPFTNLEQLIDDGKIVHRKYKDGAFVSLNIKDDFTFTVDIIYGEVNDYSWQGSAEVKGNIFDLKYDLKKN